MKIGFIGGGHIATSIMEGMLKKQTAAPEDIIVYDKRKDALDALAQRLGITAADSAGQVADLSDYCIIAVNPGAVKEVAEECAGHGTAATVFISVALGQTIAMVESYFGVPKKIIRAMPNTPALVGEGMTAVSLNRLVTQEELDTACAILRSFGRAEVIGESQMEAVVGISGSSPAYVYMFIEAMADAAVAGGMPRKTAYTFAAQAVLGSAKMVLETGEHPAALKDAVCTPGGSTIAAVEALEQNGFRSAVIQAVHACMDKAGGRK